MLFIKKLPRLIRWIASVLLLFVGVMTLLRLVFLFGYKPPGKPFSGSALLMGLRFDLKFACIMAVTILVLCSFPFANPFKKAAAAKFWNILLTVVFFITLLFYAVDYFHYGYLQQRLNASIISYFNDAAITLNMGLESYPVFKVMLLIIVATIVFAFIFKKLLLSYQTTQVIDRRRGVKWYILFFILLAWGIFGKTGQFNLRWSDAFTLKDNFKGNLALNPYQSFFSSLKYRDIKPDINKVRHYYAMMAEYFGVQKKDSIKLNFERDYMPVSSGNKPNVVLVICESFSMYRSSMAGNPFNTTPYFNSLCKNGVFFDRCFTPSYPTARGVWGTIVGIPDVLGAHSRTASRNPEVVSQQNIMDGVKGYEKFYFIGGDPTWANIKGVLLNNIDSLHLYSQDDYEAKKADVWGIDDKSLLLESNKILSKQQRPFFAVIQTADNHPPFTIPESEKAFFKQVEYTEDSLIKNGFDNNDRLNAFRYTDYCFEKFIEAAKKEKYFANTIFVFVGDHGIPGNSNSMYPRSFYELSLTNNHVPLLFYAPQLLQPKTVHHVCSQIDIMPSIATLLNQPFRNTGMGQSLFADSAAYRQNAFIIDHGAPTIGVVNNEYYYRKNTLTDKIDFASVVNNEPVPVNKTTDSIKKQLSVLTDAYFNTAKYLLYNNRKK